MCPKRGAHRQETANKLHDAEYRLDEALREAETAKAAAVEATGQPRNTCVRLKLIRKNAFGGRKTRQRK